MKPLIAFLTVALSLLSFEVRCQVVFNEFYGDPGNGKNEFFELFNTSPYAESLDDFTVVTYFEEGTKKGFYVMDLPDLSIGAKGYFVAASAKPFSYQGVSNS